MKISFIYLYAFVFLIMISCRKTKSVETVVDVKSLILGKWKLTQFKQDGQTWRDSSGVFYNFIDNSLVNTKKYIYECNRDYQLNNTTEGLKQIDFIANYSCFYQDWRSITVISVNSNTLEIMYPDYVGGGPLIKKYERFIKD